MATHYDAAIIGTGQAGPPLANRLTRAGMKVAVVAVMMRAEDHREVGDRAGAGRDVDALPTDAAL